MLDAAPGASLIPGPQAAAEPYASWRGLMLDSARTFWPMHVMRELLDLLARYRFNRLHWHLTDDAGWRFEVPGYPRLIEVASRLEREPFHWYSNTDAERRLEAIAEAPANSTHGWYTGDDIRALLEHAAASGIEIMPEVDLPGHMGAVIRAYPELGDPAFTDLPEAEWTHRNDLLWPSERSERFVRAVIDQVCRLFPHPVVHIGGDECDYSVWEADASLMAAMRERGLERGPQIQGWFTDIARDQLRRHGRTAAAWDELVETPTQGDELLFAWRDGRGVSAVRDSGHPWIFADASRLYLNRVAGPAAAEPAGMIPGFGVRSILEEVRPPTDPHLHGIQAAVWTEFITDREALHYQLFPRLLAVAEVAWNGPGATAWEEFVPRMRAEVEWLASRGVRARPLDAHTELGGASAPAPAAAPAAGAVVGSRGA